MKKFCMYIMSMCCAGLIFGGFCVSSAFAQPRPVDPPNPRLDHPVKPERDVRMDPGHIKDHDPKREEEAKATMPPPKPVPSAAAPDIKPVSHEHHHNNPVPVANAPVQNGPNSVHPNHDGHPTLQRPVKSDVKVSGRKPKGKVKHGDVMKKHATAHATVVHPEHNQMKVCMDRCSSMVDPAGKPLTHEQCVAHCQRK